jgi:hypothetical protein
VVVIVQVKLQPLLMALKRLHVMKEQLKQTQKMTLDTGALTPPV